MMNKIRWHLLWTICLLLSVIPIATTGQVWASVSQQPQSTAAQMQGQAAQLLTMTSIQGSAQRATKGMINLLLQDDEEQQAILNQNVQMIVMLLLEEEPEQETEGTKQLFLPLVTR